MDLELTEAARDLLRIRLSGERVDVAPDNRESYRELADAGLMEPVHTFAKGRNSHYRVTLAAMERRDEWIMIAIPAPSR